MKRRYRLRKNADIQRVRQRGRSTTNRLLVLVVLPNKLNQSRFGFAVSKRIGKAVQRSKLKRQMREATRLRQKQIQAGWDILFIARAPIAEASYQQIETAIEALLEKAALLKPSELV